MFISIVIRLTHWKRRANKIPNDPILSGTLFQYNMKFVSLKILDFIEMCHRGWIGDQCNIYIKFNVNRLINENKKINNSNKSN